MPGFETHNVELDGFPSTGHNCPAVAGHKRPATAGRNRPAVAGRNSRGAGRCNRPRCQRVQWGPGPGFLHQFMYI